MPLLTLGQIREVVQTDIKDEPLQKIVDAELKRIDGRVGKQSAVSEFKMAAGLSEFFTKRPIATITSIKERVNPTSAEVTLAADDYRVLGQRQIRRLTGGTNGAVFWGAEVVIVYDPVDNIDRRNLALVELVRISVEERALKSEKDGDYQATYRDPKRARKETLEGLTDGLPIA